MKGFSTSLFCSLSVFHLHLRVSDVMGLSIIHVRTEDDGASSAFPSHVNNDDNKDISTHTFCLHFQSDSIGFLKVLLKVQVPHLLLEFVCKTYCIITMRTDCQSIKVQRVRNRGNNMS